MNRLTNRPSNAELIAELRRIASFKDFGGTDPVTVRRRDGTTVDKDGADHVREATELYRQTWLDPLVDLIERRFVKPRKAR